MSQIQQTETRYDQFQLMRGVACIAVFLNHVTGYLSLSLKVTGDEWFAPLFVPLGFPWVWLFLVLSGFLLTKAFVTNRYSLSLSGVSRFYIARGRRLIPLIWAVLLIWSVLFFLQLWSKNLPPLDFKRELSIAFALPWAPYFPSMHAIASVNSPIWSALIEIHYCLIMPLLLASIRVSVRTLQIILGIWIFGTVILGIAVLVSGAPEIFPLIYGGHLYNAGFFLAGMALALHGSISFVKRIPWAVVIGIAMAAVIGAQYATSYSLNIALAILPIVFLPVWGLMVARASDDYQAASPKKFGELWRGKNPLRWLELAGIMSYSIYVAHKPISYILIDHLHLHELVTGFASLYAVTAFCFLMLLPIVSFLNIQVETRFRQLGHAAASRKSYQFSPVTERHSSEKPGL